MGTRIRRVPQSSLIRSPEVRGNKIDGVISKNQPASKQETVNRSHFQMNCILSIDHYILIKDSNLKKSFLYHPALCNRLCSIHIEMVGLPCCCLLFSTCLYCDVKLYCIAYRLLFIILFTDKIYLSLLYKAKTLERGRAEPCTCKTRSTQSRIVQSLESYMVCIKVGVAGSSLKYTVSDYLIRLEDTSTSLVLLPYITLIEIAPQQIPTRQCLHCITCAHPASRNP